MKKNNSLTSATLSLALLFSALPAAVVINPVNLGTAGDFVVLAKTAITTTAGSSIVGDLGISPAALSDMTGFDAIMDGSGQFATSALVTGQIFAADFGGATAVKLTTAISDMEAAYTDAAGRSNPDFQNLDGGVLNSVTQSLTAGLYNWGSGVSITDSITIDGGGDPNAVWIFQISNRLIMSSNANIILSNGANANNIFWQTAEGVTLGTGSHFEGTLLTMTDVAAQTNASMNGRFLVQTAATLDSNSLAAIPEPLTSAAVLGFAMLAFVLIRRRI